jgi:serine/threonine protein kinase
MSGEHKEGYKEGQQTEAATKLGALSRKTVSRIINARFDPKILEENMKKYNDNNTLGEYFDKYKEAADAYCRGQSLYLKKCGNEEKQAAIRVAEKEFMQACNICVEVITTTKNLVGEVLELFQSILMKCLSARTFNVINMLETPAGRSGLLFNYEYVIGLLGVTIGYNDAIEMMSEINQDDDRKITENEMTELILSVLGLNANVGKEFVKRWKDGNVTVTGCRGIAGTPESGYSIFSRELLKIKYRIIEFVESNKKRGFKIIERSAPRDGGVNAIKKVLEELKNYKKWFKQVTSTYTRYKENTEKYKKYLGLLDKDIDSYENTYLRFQVKHVIQTRQTRQTENKNESEEKLQDLHAKTTDRSPKSLDEEHRQKYLEIGEGFKAVYQSRLGSLGIGHRNTIQATFKYAQHLSLYKDMCGDKAHMDKHIFVECWRLFKDSMPYSSSLVDKLADLKDFQLPSFKLGNFPGLDLKQFDSLKDLKKVVLPSIDLADFPGIDLPGGGNVSFQLPEVKLAKYPNIKLPSDEKAGSNEPTAPTLSSFELPSIALSKLPGVPMKECDYQKKKIEPQFLLFLKQYATKELLEAVHLSATKKPLDTVSQYEKNKPEELKTVFVDTEERRNEKVNCDDVIETIEAGCSKEYVETLLNQQLKLISSSNDPIVDDLWEAIGGEYEEIIPNWTKAITFIQKKNKSPESAKIKCGATEPLPLHRAVKLGAPKKIVEELINLLGKMHLKRRDDEGKLPLNYACEDQNQGHLSDKNNLEICKLLYEKMDDEMTDTRSQNRIDLCLHAVNIEVRQWARKIGTFYGRYRVKDRNEPVYTSNTCKVYMASDEHLRAKLMKVHKDSLGSGNIQQKLKDESNVCIKIMTDENNFKSEMDAHDQVLKRKADDDISTHVVTVLATFDKEKLVDRNADKKNENSEYNNDLSKRGKDERKLKYEEKNYAIIMRAGEKSLDRAIADENIAGKNREKIRNIANDLANALHAIHSKRNLIHCDVKPRNLVKFRSGDETVWKLIDFDASKKKDDTITNQNKFSSGYIPPEMARLLWDHNVGDKIKLRESVKQDLNGDPVEDNKEKIYNERNEGDNGGIPILSVWSSKRDMDSDDKRDVGDICIEINNKKRWFSRSDIVTIEKKLPAHESFDAWSFGVILFYLCTGRKLFADLGASDDNIKKRSDQDQLMKWSKRSLNTALLKLDDDKFKVKDLLERCLQPRPHDRPTMSEILEHRFLDVQEEKIGEYWDKLDGSLAVPLTTGRTAFVCFLGLIVLFCTCLHVLQHIFPKDTSSEYRLMWDDPASTEDSDGSSNNAGLNISFRSHKLFDSSVAEWQKNTEKVIDKIIQLQNPEKTAKKLGNKVREKLKLRGFLLDVSLGCWFIAALFLGYSRLAKVMWPQVNKNVKSKEEIDKENESDEKFEKMTKEKKIEYLEQQPGWKINKKNDKVITCEWDKKSFSDINKAFLFEKNDTAKSELRQEQEDANLLCCACWIQCVRRCATSFKEWRPERSYAVKNWEYPKDVLHADDAAIVKSLEEQKNGKPMSVNVYYIDTKENCCWWCPSVFPQYSHIEVEKVKQINEVWKQLEDKLERGSVDHYLAHGGWPLDETEDFLASQVQPWDELYVVKKGYGHCCYKYTYRWINKLFVCIRWLYMDNLLAFFGHYGKVNDKEELKKYFGKPIFPEIVTKSSGIFLAAVVIECARAYFGSVIFTLWELRAMFTCGLLWVTAIGYCWNSSKSTDQISFYDTCIVYMCGALHAFFLKIYINMPKIAFNLLFISPTILFIAYGYDNYDYIFKCIYQPLRDSVAPIAYAREVLNNHKLHGNSSGVDDIFIHNETMVKTLEKSSAAILKKTTETHTVFQIMVAGILSDGSPNILLFMMSYLILFETSKKVLLQWPPKILETMNKWAISGMETDVREDLNKLWKTFKKHHLANALFFLTDYILLDQCNDGSFFVFKFNPFFCLALGPYDTLGSSVMRNVVIFGLTILFLSWKYWNGRFFSQGRYICAWFVSAPWVLNLGTGSEMFKVYVWLTVSYCLDPAFIWRYLTYFMLIGEVLKTPKKWKMRHEEKNSKLKLKLKGTSSLGLDKAARVRMKIEEVKNVFRKGRPTLKSKTVPGRI